MCRIRSLIIFLFLFTFSLGVVQGRTLLRSVTKEFSDSAAYVQILYHDRVMPFHSVAKDLTLKLTGKSSFAGLDATRFILSLMYFPEDFMACKFIYVKDSHLLDKLGLGGTKKIAPESLFDENGHYLLKDIYQNGEGPYDESILKLDEKIEILYSLRTGNLFKELSETGITPVAEWKIRLEVFYNQLDVAFWCYMLAFITVIITSILIYRRHCMAAIIAGFPLVIVSTVNFILKWLLGGHIPLAGGEQVMMFMTMVLSILSLCFAVRLPWLYVVTEAMAAFTALVGHLSASDPIITALSPALASPWLAFHVSVIMMAYSMFAILLPVSIACLCVKKHKTVAFVPLLHKINGRGVVLLSIGIALGSLWAKEAWGTYWSWDPKENWAAITLFIYAIPLIFKHNVMKRPHLYAVILILAFGAMVVTYYGVNYMDSLHSYGAP